MGKSFQPLKKDTSNPKHLQYRGWSEAQRWCLVEYVLRQLTDDQLLLIHSLIDPSFPPPDQDFTRMLPRCICLKIFSLLDPQSLCRAAQVIFSHAGLDLLVL